MLLLVFLLVNILSALPNVWSKACSNPGGYVTNASRFHCLCLHLETLHCIAQHKNARLGYDTHCELLEALSRVPYSGQIGVNLW